MKKAEPIRLKRGKAFHKLVQQIFRNQSEGRVQPEAGVIDFTKKTQKRNRLDILITNLGNEVAIIELKNTDWNKIPEGRVTQNLYKHQRQILGYIESYLRLNPAVDVSYGIVYPCPPKRKWLQIRIEEIMAERYGIPVYWHSIINK